MPAVEAFRLRFRISARVSVRGLRFARNLFLKYPESDGICLTGSGWRVLGAVSLLEQDLQIPIVCAVAARVWAIQKRLRVRQPVLGRGILLETMP